MQSACALAINLRASHSSGSRLHQLGKTQWDCAKGSVRAPCAEFLKKHPCCSEVPLSDWPARKPPIRTCHSVAMQTKPPGRGAGERDKGESGREGLGISGRRQSRGEATLRFGIGCLAMRSRGGNNLVGAGQFVPRQCREA